MIAASGSCKWHIEHHPPSQQRGIAHVFGVDGVGGAGGGGVPQPHSAMTRGTSTNAESPCSMPELRAGGQAGRRVGL